MIEVWEKPRCIRCKAMYTDRHPDADLCMVCRGRGIRRNETDPMRAPFRAWMRHIMAVVGDAVREG